MNESNDFSERMRRANLAHFIDTHRAKIRESIEEMIKSGEIKKEDKVEDLLRKL